MVRFETPAASAHRTVEGRRAFIMKPFPLLVLGSVLLCTCALEAQAKTRIVVQKKIAAALISGSPFAAVSSSRPALAGFTPLADYPSRTVFEGPGGSVQALIESLRSEGYEAKLAADLEELAFLGHRIDPDTGAAEPPFPSVDYRSSGRRGLYILVLRSYLTPAWLSILESRRVRLVEALSSASYVARVDLATAATLKADANFVRGLFPITPGMKIASSPTASSESVYRHILLKAVEQEPTDSVRPFLEAFSPRPIKEDRLPNGRTAYLAWLTDFEIATLALLDNVYLVSEMGHAHPSAERQGMLVLRPNVVAGRLELLEPLTENVSDYHWLLTHTSTPLDHFANTKVGIIDTGFHSGCPDQLSQCSASHPDFPSGVTIETEFFGDTADNRDGHGTITASIISAFTDFNVRADADRYRLALGIAPRVALVSDKFISCNPPYVGDLTNALERMKMHSVNVVNVSLNQCGTVPVDACGYTSWSEIVDWWTRKGSLLFTISAGNLPDELSSSCPGPDCQFVRGPASAKNAIAVGATENFTPAAWANNPGFGGTCPWNGPPAIRDARNIPSFSARRDLQSMIKPDLVAPGVRVTGPRTSATLCVSGGIFCNPANQPPLSGYAMTAGTSFAAPAVAGAAAVVRRWFQNLTGVVHPSPAMVKAILINGARDIGGPPAAPPCPTLDGIKTAAVRNESFAETACIGHIPDPYQGWGMLNLERLLGPANNYYFSDFDWHPELSNAISFWQTSMIVNDGSRPVRITLAYTDPRGNLAGVSPYRVKNDLSLGAFHYPPCNPCWYGNNFNATTGYSQPNSAANDSVNNVEQIIIPPGTYPSGTQLTVYVQANNITEDVWGFPPYCLGPDGTPPCIQVAQDFAIFAENAR